MFRITTFLIASLFISSAAFADHSEWRHHRHHHHHQHHQHYSHGYYPRYQERVFVPQPIVEYVPMRPRYYAPPPPPPVQYYRPYDQRSAQGLVGGIVGGAVGYELGRGDPLAAGIGAVAGAWLGNGMY